MAGQLLLGIDIGTYSSKGVITDPDGNVLATETIEHDLSLPRPGWAEHDADGVWWHDFVALSQALLVHGFSGSDIGAIGTSAIGGCLLPVDRKGRPLRPGILYGIDTRASAEIDLLNQQFGEEALFDLSGMSLTSQALGPKILWLKRNEPEIYRSAHKFITASSYLISRLTGEWVIDRHTASFYNPLFDIRRTEWDDRFAEPIVEIDRLADLKWADEVVGEVTERAAKETGLAAGTPVVAGSVDAASESLSIGVRQPGDMMIMYGTTMYFINVSDHPVPDPRMWSTAHLFPGLYAIDGGMSTSGALTRWFRDQLGGAEMQAELSGGPNAYQSLADLAALSPPGAGGVICLPYFAGERTPILDPDARGVFAGMTLSTTRGDLYRAALEGTAFGVRHNLEAMSEMGAKPERLVAVGGGARNNLWLQIVSDVTQEEQYLPERIIGASFGDAFLAGMGSGIIEDPDNAIDRWVRIERIVEPNPELAGLYDSYYQVYKDLYIQSADQLHRLAELGKVG